MAEAKEAEMEQQACKCEEATPKSDQQTECIIHGCCKKGDNTTFYRGGRGRMWSELSSSYMKVILLIWTTMIVSSKAAWASRPEDTVLCPLNEYIDDNDETVREFFECPGRENPPDHTICCEEKCCPMIQLDSVLKVDIRIAMIISLTVIVACILAGIILVICCFMSNCPMYDTCAGSWGKGEPRSPPTFFNGYVPGDTPHSMATLNGGRLLEKNHKVAVDIGPIKVTEADHV